MSGPSSSSPSHLEVPGENTREVATAGIRPSLPQPYHFPAGLTVWIVSKFVALALWFWGYHTTAVVVYLIPDPWLLWNIVVPSSCGFGPVMSCFRTSKPEVWLTIDDGPDPITTPQVLELLERHGARATFFVIGENVSRYPELTREISRRGHQLANHTATHPAHSLWFSGGKRFGREVDACHAALLNAGVTPSPYFRSPVGIKSVFMHPRLARRGLTLVAWSARGFDSILPEEIAFRQIMKKISPGTIVLTHEGLGDLRRVRVLERVVVGLSDAGFSTALPDPSDLTS